jgi:hypothetical protein
MKQRYLFFTLFFVTIAVILSLIVFRDQQSLGPEITLREFYKDYFLHKKSHLKFSRSFDSLLKQNLEVCSRFAGSDICGFGSSGDPYLDAQEFSASLTLETSGFKSELIGEDGVRVNFNVYPDRHDTYYDREIIYYFVWENNEWVVDDILYSTDNVSAKEWMEKEISIYSKTGELSAK